MTNQGRTESYLDQFLLVSADYLGVSPKNLFVKKKASPRRTVEATNQSRHRSRVDSES